MICEQAAKLIREGADPEHDAHVQKCAPCREELMRLQRAELCLQQAAVPELSRPAEHRMWDVVQAAQRPEPLWRWGAFGVAAIVLLVLIFPKLLLQSPAPRVEPAPSQRASVPPEPRVPAIEHIALQTLSTDQRMVLAGARLQADAGTRLSFAWTDSQPRLTLLEGKIRLDASLVDVNRAFVVETPLARFELIAAVVQVEVDDSSTTLHVEAGLVETLFEGESGALGAGGSRRFGRSIKPDKSAQVRRLPKKVKPELPPEPPKVEETPPVDEEEIKRLIQVARSHLRLEPARSIEALEGVLELALPPALEIEVLTILADAARREGKKRRAVSLYERIAEHPLGTGYAEEALLRKARLLHGFEENVGAIEVLENAAQRFEGGPLEPERRLLTARLYLLKGDAERAAEFLSGEDPSRRSNEKQALRIMAAKALIERDSELACKLVRAALKGPAVPEATIALQLLRRCQNSHKKP